MSCHGELDCLDAVGVEPGVRLGKGFAQLGYALVGFPADLYPVDFFARDKDAYHVGPAKGFALKACDFVHCSLHSGG